MAKFADVAAAWRDQTGRTCKAGNVFYRDEVIYSYGRHFPMARLVLAPTGDLVVFVTTKGYSGSTSMHLGIVRDAVKAMERFDVPDVMAKTEAAHAANHKAMLADAVVIDGQASRARAGNEPHYERLAKARRDQAYRYAALFGMPATE